ncbi:MAG TPA: hypothetical protein VD927_15360 [Chryseosolibacter sp.]|nr:hypothetical protein [Chryseosolibacter sp.]
MKSSKHNQVGNFEKLVSFTNAQGAVYNPGKASIKNAALQTLLTQAQGAIKAAHVSQSAFTHAINDRRRALNSIPPMATRLIGYLKASGVSAETLESCRKIKRRLHNRGGDRVPLTSGETPANDATRSTSQADFDSKVANFQELVTMATSDPLYKPNEADLQLKGLTAFIEQIRVANKAVAIARVALLEAKRKMRALVFGVNGIYGHGQAVKAYLKSVYGYSGSKYKEVAGIEFRKL